MLPYFTDMQAVKASAEGMDPPLVEKSTDCSLVVKVDCSALSRLVAAPVGTALAFLCCTKQAYKALVELGLQHHLTGWLTH